MELSIDFHTLFIRNDHWFPHSAKCKQLPYVCCLKIIILFTEQPVTCHQNYVLIPKVNSTVLFNGSCFRILTTYFRGLYIANNALLIKTRFSHSKIISNPNKSCCLVLLKK